MSETGIMLLLGASFTLLLMTFFWLGYFVGSGHGWHKGMSESLQMHKDLR